MPCKDDSAKPKAQGWAGMSPQEHVTACHRMSPHVTARACHHMSPQEHVTTCHHMSPQEHVTTCHCKSMSPHVTTCHHTRLGWHVTARAELLTATRPPSCGVSPAHPHLPMCAGVKAVTRYYLNNYQDGRKQDAIDLFTGGPSELQIVSEAA